MTRRLVAGTRGSSLALAQTTQVCGRLSDIWPGLNIEQRIITTTGDAVQDRPLSAIGAKGLFTKALDEALASGQIDFAVHSLKDLPTELFPGTIIAAVPPRQDPRDCLVSPGYATLAELPPGSPVGSGSPRRRSQLLKLRPDLTVADIRGNVDTRVKKAGSADYAAVVLAAAGLRRLGLEAHIRQLFEPSDMVPAIGQGALGVVCRADDTETRDLLLALNCISASREVAAERAVGEALGASCHVPIGALASVAASRISVEAVLCSPDGADVVRASAEGSAADACDVGRAAAASILEGGGRHLLNAG